jgi:GIY-YIG catalytic domain
MAQIDNRYFIYVLELKNNKYYVGKTSNAASRLAEHIKNIGAKWTKKYKPKKIIKLYRDCDSFDEDKYTIMYMAIHGIDNVRGGSFCRLNLSHSDRVVIAKMIDSATDRCFKCGSKEHFANACTEYNDDAESRLERIIEWCTKMTQGDNRYVLIDEESNKTYEFENGRLETSDIPQTKEKFVARISKKYRATLFNLSVTSFDFCVKMFETDIPPHVVVYKADGVAILCSASDEISNSLKKELEKSINTMIKTGEFNHIDVDIES